MSLVKYDTQLHTRHYLDQDDECWYFMEHLEGGYAASPSNQKISNLKKSITTQGTPQGAYKQKAIEEFADDLKAVNFDKHGDIAIVPAPTSNPRGSQNCDDRLDKVAKLLTDKYPNLILEHLIDTKVSVTPANHGGSRNIDTIKVNTVWNGFSSDEIDTIIILDDVITTGAHFKAWKEVIKQNYPNVKYIYGFFWAMHMWNEPSIEVIPEL